MVTQETNLKQFSIVLLLAVLQLKPYCSFIKIISMRDFQDTDWLVSLIKKVCLLIPVVGRKKSKLWYVHHKKEE